ncbi:hypothetical protein L6R53_09620 [Myxococcota bacterium]|nr:hypothetical protein [Myxococcota bacterium]
MNEPRWTTVCFFSIPLLGFVIPAGCAPVAQDDSAGVGDGGGEADGGGGEADGGGGGTADAGSTTEPDPGGVAVLAGPAALLGSEGTWVTGFPGTDCGGWVAPAGDVDLDGDPDVVVICAQEGRDPVRDSLLHLVDGAALLGGAAEVVASLSGAPHRSGGGAHRLGDLDGDGRAELPLETVSGTSHSLGSVLPGAAWALGGEVDLRAWELRGDSGYSPMPGQVLPDVDGDGGPDLLLVQEPGHYTDESSDGIWLFVVQGAAFAVLPAGDPAELARLPHARVVGSRALGEPDVIGGVGDVDGDGREDLGVAFGPRDAHAVDQRGSIRLVLSSTLGAVSLAAVSLEDGPEVRGVQPARLMASQFQGLGDLDGDGRGELAVLFAKRIDGSSEQPVTELGVVRGADLAAGGTVDLAPWSPEHRATDGLACDLDGDGLSEWIGADGIWAGDSLLEGAPSPVAPGVTALACLGDLDGDGAEELAVER